MRMSQIMAITVSLLMASLALAQEKPPAPAPGAPVGAAWDEASPSPQDTAGPAQPAPPEGPPGPPTPRFGPGFGPPVGPGLGIRPPFPMPPGRPGMMPPGPPCFAPPGQHWNPILRLLAERRPHLAHRLARLRERDPERFEEVLANALGARLERALDERGQPPAEQEPGAPKPPGPPCRLGAPNPPNPPCLPGPGGLRHRLPIGEHARGLQEQQDKLEQRSRELAGQLRDMQRAGANPDQQQRVRDELAQVVNQQFDVRTELRQAELERLERDLGRIQERLDRVRRNLDRRQAERAEVVERRMDQLLGQDDSGW